MNEDTILEELREQTHQLKKLNVMLFNLAIMMNCLGDPPGQVRSCNLFSHRKMMIDELEELERERKESK